MLAEAPCNCGIFFYTSPTSNKTERLEDIVGLQNPYHATRNTESSQMVYAQIDVLYYYMSLGLI